MPCKYMALVLRNNGNHCTPTAILFKRKKSQTMQAERNPGSASEPFAEDLPLSSDAAARYLGIQPNTLARWRMNGQGPVWEKHGRRVLYYRADILAYRQARRRLGTAAG